MDLNYQLNVDSMKESINDNENDQSMKSSNSSIYSSPTNTPVSPINPLDDQNVPQMSISQDEPDDPSKSEQTTKDYEELIKKSKLRMSNKFNELEKETGLLMNQDGFHILVNDSNETFANCVNKGAQNETKVLRNIKDLEFLRMEKELKRLKEELNLKNDIVDKMCKIRSQVEAELEDLTVSLFEEANKMVYSANVLRDKAEKDLVEANLKIDMLSAEVEALKLMVITSTPSKPNPHLHPQLNSPKRNTKKNDSQKVHSSLPVKSPSNYELGNNKGIVSNKNDSNLDELKFFEDSSEIGEIDPIYYEEFVEWKKSPTFEPMNSNFIKRVYDEEIYPVFNFKNKDLTASVLRSIENNSLTVESVNSESFPRKCALIEVPKACSYRMKVDDERWYAICQLSRNRITTVCDLFCYLSYVKNGLVKSDAKEIYWQIMKKRHSIATSKLGFLPSSL